MILSTLTEVRCVLHSNCFPLDCGDRSCGGVFKAHRVVPLELRSTLSCQLKGPATSQGPRNPIPSFRFTCGVFTPMQPHT
eukprot:1395769-Prymnesium_polylepis.1